MDGSKSACDEKLREEIREALLRSQNDLPAFKSVITNKHAIIFLGNTRSGKSTLVNYIIGTKLVAFEERSPLFKIEKESEESIGPKIGQGSQSCTTIPGVYSLNQFGMVIVDAPGFDDNRSEAQDIVNALYISQIKFAKTVKFVLVCDINELLMDNVKAFTDLMTKTHVLLPNFENFKKSVSIVFTKDYRSYTQDDVIGLLKRKVLEVDSLLVNKELVKYFIENPQVIAFFRMPNRAGRATAEIDVNVETARFVSCAVVVDDADIRVSISAKSRLALIKIYDQYLDSAYFEQELKCIIDRFVQYFEIDDYVYASTKDELDDVKQNLKRISQLFVGERETELLKLCDIRDSLIRIFPINIPYQFITTFNLLILIDNATLMEDAIRAKFIRQYKLSLEEIVSNVEKLITEIDKELKDREDMQTMFTASATATGVASGAAVAGEILHRVFSHGSRLTSPFGIIGALGTVIGGIGVGLTGTTFAVQKDALEKRKQARARQGRRMYDNIFEES